MKYKVVIKYLLIAFFVFFIKCICLAGPAQSKPWDAFVSQWTKEESGTNVIHKAQDNFVNGLYDETIAGLQKYLSSELAIPDREKALIYTGLASSFIEKCVINVSDIGNKEYYGKASSYFHSALKLIDKQDPLNISICSGLGFLCLELQEYPQALIYLRQGLAYPLGSFQKEHVDILTNLGIAYLRLHKYQETAQYFSEVIKVMGDSLFDRLNKGGEAGYVSNMGRVSLITDKYNELRVSCEKANEFIGGGFREFHFYLDGIILYEEFKDYFRVNRFTQPIIKQRDEPADLYIRLGYLALGLMKYNEAIGYFNRGLEVSGEAGIFPLYLGLAVCYQKLSNYDGAIKFLQKGMKYFEGLPGKGYIILSLKQYEAASRYFIQVLKLSAQDPLRLALMNCLNTYLNALHLRQISDSSPLKFKEAQPDSGIILGNIAFDSKFYRAAISHFNQAFKYSPKNQAAAYICFMLGCCYEELKDYDKAIVFLDKVLSYPLSFRKGIKGINDLVLKIKISQNKQDTIRLNPD